MGLRQLLAEGRRVQLDGGLSTALEELGADLDDPLWTARVLRDQPELVLAAHEAFVRAGAEIVISASYQAPDELLAESVRIARGAGVLVAGSVAPYGASLAGGQEYTGDYDVPGGLARAPVGAAAGRRSRTSSRSRRSRVRTRRRRSPRWSKASTAG